MKKSLIIMMFVMTALSAFAEEECTVNGVDQIFALNAKSVVKVQRALMAKGFEVVSNEEKARFRLFFRNIEGGVGQANNRWRGYNASFYDYGVKFISPKGSAYSAGLFVNYEKLIRNAALDAVAQLPKCPGIIEHANPD